MTLPFYWVDAFTNRVFGGNPAGLVPLAHWLPAATMQAIARQNGLAETAFFVRTGPARWHLRWFTPESEINLCGHATLATAHLILRELRLPTSTLTFDTLSGPLTVQSGPEGRLVLDFPAWPAQALSDDAVRAAITTALGGPAPVWLGKARDVIAVFPTAEDVRALQPDFIALGKLSDVVGVIATAPGEDCDFVSRFFAPGAGIPEDPVTGSAHCTLMPYWVEKLGRPDLHARQLSARGGELWCKLSGTRVHIAGQAVTYLRGTLTL